jgi:hypothetical protein
MYFNVVPKDDVPCSVLLNNNIKAASLTTRGLI